MPGSQQQPGSGKLVVISAPSGAGKTTIAREILRLNPGLVFSVSATTRAKRRGEAEGVDYYFLSREEFRRRVDAGEFVEWEEVYGDSYGTLRAEVDRALGSGRGILFDVDVKGGLSIKRAYPNALLVFLRPPSLGALEQRLRNRRTENPETLARRLARVPMELEKGKEFDHQVVNETLSRAIADVQNLVHQYLHHDQ